MNWRWATWFGGILLIGLLALFPLRIAIAGMADHGFTARQAAGTIWYGRIGELMLHHRRLGTFEVTVEPLPLLVGSQHIRLNRMDDPDGRLDGMLLFGRTVGVRDLNGKTGASGMFGDLPLETFEAQDIALAFRDGRCVEAEGLAKVLLSANLPGFNARQLSGTLRCEGERVRFRLADPQGAVSLEFYVRADGRYRAWLSVQGAAPQVAALLAGAGFRPGSGGMTLSSEGVW